jgi:hypothetical protein
MTGARSAGTVDIVFKLLDVVSERRPTAERITVLAPAPVVRIAEPASNRGLAVAERARTLSHVSLSHRLAAPGVC